MSISHVHDKFVDHLFSNQRNLTDFIKNHLPSSLVEQIDISTVRLKKGKKTSRQYRRYHKRLEI
jgi:predicted transposase YdaD